MGKELTKPCSTCGATMAKTAKVCPSCGAKNKRPIFKKWWFWLIVIIVIVIAANIGGNSSNDSDKTAKADTSKTTTAEKTSTEKIYAVGDSFAAGKLGIIVNKVGEQTVFKSGNQFIDDVTTDGKFVVVNVTLTNNDTSARMFDSTQFKLIDSQKREFDPYTDTDLMMIIGNDNDLFLENCNPGMSRTGTIVFEVPADTATYDLAVDSGVAFAAGETKTVKLK
jgi:RNA polymerase subunit RPABC4/transcription elongation factor Spt4